MSHRPASSAFYLAPWTAAFLAFLLAEIFPAGAEREGEWAFLASALILGLPHGALDLWWPRVEWPQLRGARAYLAFLASYLLVMGVMALVWRLHVPTAFGGFILLTAWHWGSGDLWPWPQSGGPAIAWSLAKGLLVMGAPLAFHPDEVQAFFASLNGASFEASQWKRLGAGLVILAAVAQVAGAVLVYPRPWFAGTLEWVGLLLLAWRLPAFGFIAVYFGWFHALRHLLRVQALSGWTMRALLRRSGIVALLLVLATAGFWWGARGTKIDLSTSLAVYFMGLSVLTLPHALLIAVWDRRSWLGAGLDLSPK